MKISSRSFRNFKYANMIAGILFRTICTSEVLRSFFLKFFDQLLALCLFVRMFVFSVFVCLLLRIIDATTSLVYGNKIRPNRPNIPPLPVCSFTYMDLVHGSIDRSSEPIFGNFLKKSLGIFTNSWEF